MALFGRKKAAKAEAEAKARAEAAAKAEAEAKAKAEAAAKAKAEAEKNAKLAPSKKIYADLCRAMDETNWKYTKKEEELRIETGVRGDDLPMYLYIDVDADRQCLRLLSPIPVTVPEDKRLDVAAAISTVNNLLVDGCFDYNILDGSIYFRMAYSYIDMTFGTEFYMYMLHCSCQIIDEYNDKFLMLAKGMLTLEQFLAAEN